MSWHPTEAEIDEKLIEMAYVWGDIEEELEAFTPLAGKESDDYQAIRDSWLAKQVAEAFRVEAQYGENGFGDACVYYVLLFDVTDQEARDTARAVEDSETLRGFVRQIARPWHSDDFLVVKLVPPSTPVTGQVCRRFLEDHPAKLTPDLDDVPTFDPGPGGVELVERWPYHLTPIELPIFERLAETGLTFSVQPWIQHADQKFRVDFLVFYDGGVVAVELDGHDFHKTKEHRGRDAEKQNFLAGRKITMIRFTGTQVYSDPDGCVRQILDIVRAAPARP